MEALPQFKYHPDPVASGSVEADAAAVCSACGQPRGYIYFDTFDDDARFCPWCIAAGAASEKFEVEFNDAGTMEEATPAAMEEISRRTPGFASWQESRWLTCCGDAAAFLGPAGTKELRKNLREAIPAVKLALAEEWDLEGDLLRETFQGLEKDGQPTAYVFRCLHCRKYLAYVDMT